RGLLVALEPLQVVRRVAGATYDVANAALCAAVVTATTDGAGEESAQTSSSGLVACVFDREGSAEGAALVDAEKLRRWLLTKPSASVLFEKRAEFFLRDDAHRVE